MGETNATLVLPSAQPEQEGDYSVLLLNTAGSILSVPAHLSLLLPAHVIVQPPDGAIGLGSNYNLTATVLGWRPASAPLFYQWQFGGAPLAGGSGTLSGASAGGANLSYPITNAALANAGYYSLFVSNQYGADLSRLAFVDVLVRPRVVQQPPSLIAAVGEDVTFVVTASGSLPLQVRWRKGSSGFLDYATLPGSIASLTLPKVVLTNAAWYTAVFKNAIYPNPIASDSSAPGVLTVVKPPTNRLGPQGTAVTLEALLKAATNVFWAWEFNGTNLLRGLNNSNFNTFTIATITTNLLTLTNLQPPQLGTYTFRVTNASFSFTTNWGTGNPVITTNWVQLGDARSFSATVGFGIQATPPTILSSPVSQTNRQGTTATFTTTAIATWPVTYSWFLDGTNLVASTNSSNPTNVLTLTNVQPAQMGDYTVVISNSAGAVTSDLATLTVQWAPVILTQPQNQTAVQGGWTLFAVAADGTQPLQYQWNRQTTRLAGETNSTLLISNVQPASLGNYWVSITNAFGGLTSQWASLSYPTPPAITQQPTNCTAPAGSPATFSVIASGTAPLAYQWYAADAPVSNAVNATLLLPAVQARQAGPYKVIVFNAAGSITSQVATLTVTVPPPPAINTQPADLTVLAGGTASFTVVAGGGGGGPYAYQWFQGTALLSNQINATLTLPGVQSSQAGGYQVIVIAAGGSVTSRVATLTVLVPPTISIQPTNQTAPLGGTASFTVVVNGTAPLSYLWWFNNTPLFAQTNASLLLTGITKGQAGAYFVFITNLAGQAISAVVSLTIPTPLHLAAPVPLAPGQFQITITGTPGQILDVLASPNLAQWTTNTTLTNATGRVSFTNSSTLAPSQFYRVRQR